MLGDKVVELFNLSVNGDHKKAAKLQRSLIGPNQAVTKQFGVPGLKVMMEKLEFNSGQLRSPLTELSASDKEKVIDIFIKYNKE